MTTGKALGAVGIASGFDQNECASTALQDGLYSAHLVNKPCSRSHRDALMCSLCSGVFSFAGSTALLGSDKGVSRDPARRRLSLVGAGLEYMRPEYVCKDAAPEADEGEIEFKSSID